LGNEEALIREVQDWFKVLFSNKILTRVELLLHKDLHGQSIHWEKIGFKYEGIAEIDQHGNSCKFGYALLSPAG